MNTSDRVRAVAEDDVPRLTAWRNHDAVRQYMFNTERVGEEESRAWFARQFADPQVHLLMFEREGVPSGYARFQMSAKDKIADWGFYRAPDAPSGTGYRLGVAALTHAFETLEAYKVCGRVIAFNEPSVRLHERLGFALEGSLREQYFSGTERHDVFCFGLLARDWRACTHIHD